MNEITTKTKLISKRNNVYLIKDNGKKSIQKTFLDKKYYLNEKQILLDLSSTQAKLCPTISDCNNASLTLTLEFINGVTVLEQLEEYETTGNIESATNLFLQLFSWIEQFHSVFNNKIALNDVNLRNFIVYDNKIYGIDFELCTKGNPKNDYIYAISMYTLYTPINSHFKLNVLESLYSLFFKYQFDDQKNFYDAINTECYLINKRRK